jgi:sigma-B regulation protein RsbU (phosphoserine phosphatase)
LQEAKEFSPAQILQQVNLTVYGDTKISEVFATISILILNNRTMELKYSGAGDIPIIYKNSNEDILRIKSKGLLLGFSKNGDYEDSVINLKPGEQVYLTTDGLIDSRAKSLESFGEHRLYQLIKNMNPEQNPLHIIKSHIEEFTAGEYDDDLSLILIQATS